VIALLKPGVRLRYLDHGYFAIQFPVENVSSRPITITAIAARSGRLALLHLVGVRLTKAPPPPKGDSPAASELGPLTALPAPRAYTIPPRGTAEIQENFQMGNCRAFAPGSVHTYNRRIFISFTSGAGEIEGMPFDLPGDQLTLRAPSRNACAH
jgi:hypothetical protein